MNSIRPWISALATTLAALLLGGCAQLAYMGHVVSGQWDVLSARRPIAEVIADPRTEEGLRVKLQAVVTMREYAVTALGLPAGESFHSYADLGRPYVLWNVYAAPELSLEPKHWCYVLFGCISYRAYFDPAKAEQTAARLAREGWDVHIAVSPAYSTLGWFDDPVYQPILEYDMADIAGLLFHELAHQRLYVSDDTTFNESFAMSVQLEGARRWLRDQGRAEAYAAYRRGEQRDEAFVALLLAFRGQLAELYVSPLSDDQKRHGKATILAALRGAYDEFKAAHGGFSGYDFWFERGINNATLAPLGTYHGYVPAFEALLAEQGGDLARFYHAAEAIGRLPPAQRHARLAELMERKN